MTDTPFEGDIALVTGASRGLGFAVAEALGAGGAQVVAVARTVGGLEALDDAITSKGGATPVLVPLDLTKGDGIDQMGAALFERFGKLDIVVHCAAQSAPLSPVAHAVQKDVEKAFALNVDGTWRLIRSLDLLLRQSDRGRLVYIADEKAGGKFWGAYGASKAAGLALARSYGAETPSVHVEIFEPPPMPTALRARTHPGEPREDLTATDVVAKTLLARLTALKQ